MTARKRFKRLVRARSSRTGESYSSALRHFRALTVEDETVPNFNLQRIERPHLGFAVSVPPEWAEEPPDLNNSPHEVLRFAQRGEDFRRIIVFRDPSPGGRDAAGARNHAWEVLAAGGYRNFVASESAVAGRPGARLDFDLGEGPRRWAVREYFVMANGVGWCFGPEIGRAHV